MHEYTEQRHSRLQAIIAAIGALAFVVIMTIWGGLPSNEELPLFVIGTLVLIVAVGIFAGIVWHLLFRPLPANYKVVTASGLTLNQRRVLAVLTFISSLNLVVGAFWDEVWHRQYGVPFGEDFFWRPHLMMYFGLALTILLAGGGLYFLMTQGKGSLQQRFRADPTIGLLVIVGGFLIYAVPADPLWHLIYGEDLSAWSIPHLLIAVSFSSIMLLAAAIQLSTMKAREWGTVLSRFSPGDIIPLVSYGFALMLLMQLFTTEWEALTPEIVANRTRPFPAFWTRPEWIFPALISAISLFIGTFTLHTLRYAGAATLMGVLSLVVRAALLQLFQFEAITINGWLLMIPPLVALDIVYGLWVVRRGDAPSALISGIAGGAAIAVISFPLINQFYIYPTITTANLPVMVLATIIAGIVFALVGKPPGNFVAAHHARESELAADSGFSMQWLAPVALVAMIAFIGFFVATAAPPV